jgi:2-polyprenyl-3-methyl-5-hydroxy-6-metoxy-1,4-benzoquinol methylase
MRELTMPAETISGRATATAARDRYVIRGGVAGRERLRVLARAFGPTTAALLDRVPITAGMRCLDAGCGGGDVTRELARRAAPGRVLGVDFDTTKLALARAEAEAEGIHNVDYRAGNIVDTELAQEYDAIYARFLLTHLTDPAGTIARFVAGLRPGGVLIVEDIDFRGMFCHPASAAYDRYVDLYMRTTWARGVDPNIGPRLPALLTGAGLADVHLNVVQPAATGTAGVEGDIKRLGPMTLESIADSAIAEQLISRDDLGALLDELYELARDTTTLVALPRVMQTWGYRT